MAEAACAELQRELDAAILRLLGAAASRFSLFRGDPVKREAVCPAAGRDRRGADLQSSVPRGMFRRMEIAAQRQDADAPAPVRLVLGGGVCVTVVSEFGFEHQREYASGADLGEAMVQELAAPAALVANARVGKDGTLYFVSRLFMERQRGLGKLLCTVCGAFSASEKGLRHHQQIVHGNSYEESKDFAGLAKHQQLAAGVWLTIQWLLWRCNEPDKTLRQRRRGPGRPGRFWIPDLLQHAMVIWCRCVRLFRKVGTRQLQIATARAHCSGQRELGIWLSSAGW